MESDDYICVSLKWEGDPSEFSQLHQKIKHINDNSSDIKSFLQDLNPVEFKKFDHECAKLTRGKDLITLETEVFSLTLKCSKIIEVCERCLVALYGNFYSEEDLKLKFCDKDPPELCRALSELRGSHSLVYISLHQGYVFVSKDQFGFKSLLVSLEPLLSICNVPTDTSSKWHELPPFVSLVFGSSPFLYKRSNLLLNHLTKVSNADYKLLNQQIVSSAIDKVTASLTESVCEALSLRTNKECVTVLFSGGLDSSLLSVIALKNTEKKYVELVNIAFDGESAPDRITCLITFEELVELFPNEDLRLLLVDVDLEDYSRDEKEIFKLCYPNDTHMDLNISASLYYAGQLKGHLLSREYFKSESWIKFKNDQSVLRAINLKVTTSKERKDSKSNVEEESEENLDQQPQIPEMDREWKVPEEFLTEYSSKSKEVLMGTGADELFGGYGRHVSAKMFDEKNYFSEEINKDILRLWKRNFGRDDRVLNSRNIQALYPFLSTKVLECLQKLPFNPSVVVDLLDPPEWLKGLDFYANIDLNLLSNPEFLAKQASRTVSVFLNKWVLREVCFRLGLRSCCNFKKRAIQFGTKSAKVFNKIHNMSNRQASNKGSATFSHF